MPWGWLVAIKVTMNILVSLQTAAAQLPRGCYFCLDTKVTKKSSQQKCFLARLAFAAQSRKNCGLQSFRLTTLSRYYRAMRKFAMPFTTTQGQQFFLLSPEAYLLTEEFYPYHSLRNDPPIGGRHDIGFKFIFNIFKSNSPNMKSFLRLLLAGTILIASCKNRDRPKDAVALPKDDAIFLELKDTAQAHLQTFIDTLKAHAMDTSYSFKMKSDYTEKDNHEHMWSDILGFKADTFRGVFTDSAFVLKNIKQGDKVAIARRDVEDWIIYNNKTRTQIGYYSESYLKSKR